RATRFAGNRSGERYGAVLGVGQAPGGVLPGAGKAVSAAQFDVTFDGTSPIKLYGHYGMTRDADTNGSAPGKPEESWRYYAGDFVYKFTPAIYAAARYSAADAMKLNDINSNGKVDRIQLGGSGPGALCARERKHGQDRRHIDAAQLVDGRRDDQWPAHRTRRLEERPDRFDRQRLDSGRLDQERARSHGSHHG